MINTRIIFFFDFIYICCVYCNTKLDDEVFADAIFTVAPDDDDYVRAVLDST